MVFMYFPPLVYKYPVLLVQLCEYYTHLSVISFYLHLASIRLILLCSRITIDFHLLISHLLSLTKCKISSILRFTSIRLLYLRFFLHYALFHPFPDTITSNGKCVSEHLHVMGYVASLSTYPSLFI